MTPDVSAGTCSDSLPQAFFHEDSGTVRFWVRTAAGDTVGASVRKEVMQFRFRPASSGADALKVYQDHRETIDAAVLRRVASGSIEPVMLREADFGAR